MKTSDRVVEILVKEGAYRLLPHPFVVGSLPFEFSSVLVASEKANDLVIVIEIKGDAADSIAARKVLALTRALDVMRSKRPVTAVLTSGQPDPHMVQAISKVCRVLSVGAPTGPDAPETLRDWLSVLLPLSEPTASTVLDWQDDLSRIAPKHGTEDFLSSLLNAAPFGKAAVETALAERITKSLQAMISNDERNS